MNQSNLWFISISSLEDATDFASWLFGKLKIFNDTMEFRDWIDAYTTFPLDIYLDGIRYSFNNRREADLFLVGFEAALNIRISQDGQT